MKIIEIDWDTWSESGGTAGIYGKYLRNGQLKILSPDKPEDDDEDDDDDTKD